MHPLLPSRIPEALNQLSETLLNQSHGLAKGIHPLTAQAISESVLLVQSYYTNSMEGNPTRLGEIEKAALNQELSLDPTARNHQLEHLAHIETQKKMIEWIKNDQELNICSPEFLSKLHREFYRHIPPEMHFATKTSGEKVPVIPGAWREQAVIVGQHTSAPKSADEIDTALKEFSNTLNPLTLNSQQRFLALASSHHRFLWIHPFADGNGRVARLLTQAYSLKMGIDPYQLVSIARGFARNRTRYDQMLATADRMRRNDWDGRGPLSEEDLVEFCIYFLKDICIDQFQFMHDLTKADVLRKNIDFFLHRALSEKKITKTTSKLVLEVFLRGSLPRGDVSEICDVKSRQASKIITASLQSDLLKSKSAYGDLTLKISGDFRRALFPQMV